MKRICLPAILAVLALTACKKNDENTSVQFNATKDAVIVDFVNVVALPGYADLKQKAAVLNSAVINLNATTTEANLLAAKTAWKDMRATWEKCEGYLFGPVDDNEYDPETDTWPVNFVDMDALIADATHDLSVADIQSLSSRALKGYHPIEYILWGEGGARTAASLTARQKTYLGSLAFLIKENADNLYSDWNQSEGNYASKVLSAGAGSSVFSKKQHVLLAITEGMIGICGEVGEGKIAEPYSLYPTNPALARQNVESPYSGNSLLDFRNNIVGAYNVYQGKFISDGAGIEDLLKARNSALDVELQQKFNTAIQSFNNFSVPFEDAIASERSQCAATMTALADLATCLNDKLKPFIITNSTD